MTVRTHGGRARASWAVAGAGWLLGVLVLAGCGSDPAPSTGGETSGSTGAATSDSRFPDVTGAELTAEGGGTYSVNVTISSPYDSPERYADGWRVLGPDGAVLGEKTLTHDHASEQPFTRTQTGLRIPGDISTVTVEGRDSENGYGGATVDVPVPSG